jgi:hypothetical protein
MPIEDKNLGKYRVPGIYIEEVDQSVINLPIQEVLINLVPGFSRKGPFNNPTRVNNISEFERIFGSIDKGLETKGSYFHRTVETMLDQGPVWALNLLATDPTRDKLEWKSISLATQYDNGSLISSPYERFFNRQDFWIRDDDSFNDIVIENNNGAEDDDRLLHITNMSDKVITVFMFKSDAAGFDISAEQWYGGRNKVPLFMNSKDMISDYLVSILIVYGDWSDYKQLSGDATWSAYFGESGLYKTKVEDFANHYLVTRLAYYDASLIPNFKDLNNRDMYIKNIINNDTDKTGLFCTFNEDILLNADSYQGKIDLIGQTLVGLDDVPGTQPKTTIDFLSYTDSISESVTFTEKGLDSSANVFGNYAADMTTAWISGRTAGYTNWYTKDIASTGSSSLYTDLTSCDGTNITLASVTGLDVDDVVYFSKNFDTIDRTTPYYVKTVVGSDITISTEKGGPPLTSINTGSTTDIDVYKISYQFDDNASTGFYNIGGYRYYLSGETEAYLAPFVMTSSAQTYQRYDVIYLTSTGISKVTGTQTLTSASKPNYLVNNNNSIILGYTLTSYDGAGSFTINYTGVTVDSSGYKKIDSNFISTNTGSTTTATYLDIIFDDTYGSSSDWTNYTKLRSLKIYAELAAKLALGKAVVINKSNGYKYVIETYSSYDATVTENARIRIYFGLTDDPYDYIDTADFILYYTDDEFQVGDGSVSQFTTTLKPQIDATEGVIGKYSSLYLSYVNGVINNDDYYYVDNNSGDTAARQWIRMYLDSNRDMVVKFLNQLDPVNLTTIDQFDTGYGGELIVHSEKSNWKQTVEIENPSTITDSTNTTSIYVKKDRYSEIIKGTYLESYYDTSYYDYPGTGYLNGEIPRKWTRILDVKNDTVDTTLKILYTDAPIKIYTHSDTSGTTIEYFTTSYYTIDNYVSTYKGIAINPFKVHADSIPNKTESRQDSILDVIAKGTRLAQGLTNKNRITWRYLVDSFGLGLTSDSKQQYIDLCGDKLNALGFINMPSAKDFKKSSNPSFISSDGSLSMEFIKEGADASKNPDFYYSFGEGVGRSCVSYWFPYIKTDDESSKFIPPAAEIAKTFMNKFTTIDASIRPWTILAGVIRGSLTNVRETEIRFTYADLEYLHDMGSNPIEYVENYGFIINSDNSAQVYPYSSLSLIHSREVLIELENRLYDMLLNYHWRFNTPEIRAEIKYRADQICKELAEADAIYAYRNVCDKTNNPDYIIDLQMGVLDTYIEIIKGMGIIVNQITILRKGTIESSGFLQT